MYKELVAIGAIYSEVCGRKNKSTDMPSVSGSYVTALSLDPDQCRKLVHENWEKLRSQIDDELQKHRSASKNYSEAKDTAFDRVDGSKYHAHEYVPEEDFKGLTEQDLHSACQSKN